MPSVSSNYTLHLYDFPLHGSSPTSFRSKPKPQYLKPRLYSLHKKSMLLFLRAELYGEYMYALEIPNCSSASTSTRISFIRIFSTCIWPIPLSSRLASVPSYRQTAARPGRFALAAIPMMVAHTPTVATTLPAHLAAATAHATSSAATAMMVRFPSSFIPET